MEVYELESCVRGHHIYGRVWRATVDEQLECRPEPRNKEDPYAHTVQSMSSWTRATTNIRGRILFKVKIGDF